MRLFYYPNRIEVHNPGLLLPGIRLTDLRQGRVPSRPRNPILANLLRDMPGGYMERLGSGIGFMIREMRALGRPEPEFREQNEFIVTFHLAAALSNTPTSLEVDEQVAPDMAERQIGGATSGKRALDAAQRLEAALRYVQEHGAITNKAYRNLTSVSDMTALRDLETLVTQGSLRVVGQGRGRKYTL